MEAPRRGFVQGRCDVRSRRLRARHGITFNLQGDGMPWPCKPQACGRAHRRHGTIWRAAATARLLMDDRRGPSNGPRAMPEPTTNRPRPEDFLELVQQGKRGRLKLYIGFAAGVGKTYRMLEEAHALKKRGRRRRPRLRRDPRPRRDGGADRGAGGGAAPADRVPRRHRRGDEPQRHPQAQPRGRHRRRAGPHQRPRQPQQEALPGRAGAARRRASTSSARSTSSTWRASTTSSSGRPASRCARPSPTASSSRPTRW